MKSREKVVAGIRETPLTRSEVKKPEAESQVRTDSRVHYKCAFEIFVQDAKSRVSKVHVLRLSCRCRALTRGPKVQQRAAADAARPHDSGPLRGVQLSRHKWPG